MIEIPSLENKKSLQDFIKDYVLVLKNLGSEKVKTWAEDIGFGSRITFKHFLAGRKNLSSEQIIKVKESLDMSESERNLVDQKVISTNEQVVDSKTKTVFVSEDFFQTPLNTIVLNLCGIKPKMSFADIKHILRGAFTEIEIEKSVTDLLDLNLISRRGDHSLVRIFEGKITSIPGQKSTASQKYFHATYELADKAWNFPLQIREMSAFTFTIDAQDIPRMKDMIRKFRKDLAELSPAEQRNSVFQCSLATFPIYLENKSEVL